MDPANIYFLYFNELQDLWDQKEFMRCEKKEKLLLKGPTLPHIIIIKTCVLVANSTEA